MDHVTTARPHRAAVMTQRLREMRLDPPGHDRRPLRRGDHEELPQHGLGVGGPAERLQHPARPAAFHAAHEPAHDAAAAPDDAAQDLGLRARRRRDLAEEPREVGGVAERHDPGARGDGAGLGDEGRRIEGLDRGTGTSCHVGVTSLAGAIACSGSAVTGSSARTSRRRAAAAAARPSQRIGPSGCIHASERSASASPRSVCQMRRTVAFAVSVIVASCGPRSNSRRSSGPAMDPRLLGSTARCAAQTTRIGGTVERRAQHVRGDEAADGAVVRARHERGERRIGPGALHERRLQEPPPALRGPGGRERLGQQLGDPRQVCVVERADGRHGTELP